MRNFFVCTWAYNTVTLVCINVFSSLLLEAFLLFFWVECVRVLRESLCASVVLSFSFYYVVYVCVCFFVWFFIFELSLFFVRAASAETTVRCAVPVAPGREKRVEEPVDIWGFTTGKSERVTEESTETKNTGFAPLRIFTFFCIYLYSLSVLGCVSLWDIWMCVFVMYV